MKTPTRSSFPIGTTCHSCDHRGSLAARNMIASAIPRIWDVAHVPPWRAFARFGGAYILAVWLADHTYGDLAVPSPFWLPDSVFLCALLMTRRSEWWLLALAIWPIRLCVGAVPGTPLWFELVSVANDTAKGLICAWLLQHFARRPIRLHTLREFILLLGIAATAVPALSALAAAPARYALGDSFWRATYQWFLGDSLTQVVVTPTILYWWTLKVRGRKLLELVIVCGCIAGTLLFGLNGNQHSYSLLVLYLPVPFLIWAAVRLGPFGTATSLALVGIVLMIAAVGGKGVFAGESPEQAVLSIQLFLLVVAMSLLALAIILLERDSLLVQQEALTNQLIRAQDTERSRIAKELHDDIGQQMALLLVNIDRMRTKVELPITAQLRFEALAEDARQISSDVRALSHQLHPLMFDLVGFERAARALCQHVSARHGLQIDLQCHGIPADLRHDVSLCAYRIVQEALQNVVKHSSATRASIEVRGDADQMTVCVTDTGKGFDLTGINPPSGFGLLSMRERIHALDGDFVINTQPEGGTRLRAVLPLRREPDEVGGFSYSL